MVVFVRKAWLVFWLFWFLSYFFGFGSGRFFFPPFCFVLGSLCVRSQHSASSSSNKMKRLHHLVTKALTQVAPVGSHPWFAVISLPVAVACTVLVCPPPEHAKNSVPPFLELVHRYHQSDFVLLNPPRERRTKGLLRPGTLKLRSQPTSVLLGAFFRFAFFALLLLERCAPVGASLLRELELDGDLLEAVTVVAMYPCYSVRRGEDAAGRGPAPGGGGEPHGPPCTALRFTQPPFLLRVYHTL